jgi:hypothetical protein
MTSFLARRRPQRIAKISAVLLGGTALAIAMLNPRHRRRPIAERNSKGPTGL